MASLVSRLYDYGIMEAVRDGFHFFAWPVSTWLRPGENIYDREWDALLVLDTCRLDAMQHVSAEYSFLSDVSSIWSVGSATNEWVANTFTKDHTDEINGTLLISCNVTYHVVLEDHDFGNRLSRDLAVHFDDFLAVDEAWNFSATNPVGLQPPPETVVERTIALAREHDPDRLIVHFKQPHTPYTANAIAENRDLRDYEADPWGALRSGADKSTIWGAYLDELRHVLDHIDDLRDNLDADKMVLTADHGDLFGEWGIYAHPACVPHPDLRKVPWVETTATDERTLDPDINEHRPEELENEFEDRLRDLGYLE